MERVAHRVAPGPAILRMDFGPGFSVIRVDPIPHTTIHRTLIHHITATPVARITAASTVVVIMVVLAEAVSAEDIIDMNPRDGTLGLRCGLFYVAVPAWRSR